MPVNWVALQERMDAIVDDQFSETVEFRPWSIGSGYVAGGPDTTRKVFRTKAIYVTPGSTIVGEGGTSAGFLSRQVEDACWISVQSQFLGDPSSWKVGCDRVFMVDRNELYEINYIGNSATYRNNVHLVRVKE